MPVLAPVSSQPLAPSGIASTASIMITPTPEFPLIELIEFFGGAKFRNRPYQMRAHILLYSSSVKALNSMNPKSLSPSSKVSSTRYQIKPFAISHKVTMKMSPLYS